MKIYNNVFKAYDIRGKYPSEVNETFARSLGGAAVKFFSKKNRKRKPVLLVGSDTRRSSPSLRESVLGGITEKGISVFDIGEVTTPLFYFAIKTLKADGGIMITASHNPPEYNGFKINDRSLSVVAPGSGLEIVQKFMKRDRSTISGKKRMTEKRVTGRILLPSVNIKKKYLNFIAGLVKINRHIRVVVDAGGGATALLLPDLLSDLKLLYKPLFFEIDRDFSRHSPNPFDTDSQKNIRKMLRDGGYALGVMFDGDGDRVIFFNEKGEEVGAHSILGLLAEARLKEKSKVPIVFELTLSRALEEFIKENKGRPIKTKKGRVAIKEAMIKTRSPVGGESSGHFFLKDFFYSDSGLLNFLKVLEIVSRAKKPLSRLALPLQRYFASGELNFTVSDPRRVLAQIKHRFQTQRPRPLISDLDGVSIAFPEWWFNIRPSNTEPLIRLNLEAKTGKILKEKILLLRKLIKTAD